jgi:RimJ/RimL family protein N-acetyltransferase
LIDECLGKPLVEKVVATFAPAVEELAAAAESRARILTPRLELIPLGREHAEDLFTVLSDRTLYEYTGGAPPASVADLRDRYAGLESRHSPDRAELWLNWALSEAATGTSVGWLQATVNARYADLAWLVGTPWQRRGYATEAVRALVIWLRGAGVSVVRANVHPLHTASQRVAANAGLLRTSETIDGEDVWVCRI